MKARWPSKNFTDVTPAALLDTKANDKYSELVLAAPTVDITNLNTTKLTPIDNIEVYKQNIVASCHNMVTVAETATRRHPELRKVTLMEHAPRFDEHDVDPTGLKPKLAKFANITIKQMLDSSPLKDVIVVGRHQLDYGGDHISAMYRDDRNGWYDGVHLYGREGKKSYTKSMIQMMKSEHSLPSSSSPSYHASCPQTQFQNRKKTTNSTYQPSQNIFTVPVNNMFDILGN